MKIYKTQAEVKKDIKNGVLAIEGDVEFRCSIFIDASIQVNAGNITAWDITARDITAFDLNVGNLTVHDLNAISLDARNVNARNVNIACNINANDIKAHNITALNIVAWDIKAHNVNALNIAGNNIQAWSINADDISYYAFCNVYDVISCASINSRREPHSEPVCLDGELIIKAKPTETIKIGNNTYSKDEVETALRDVKTL